MPRWIDISSLVLRFAFYGLNSDTQGLSQQIKQFAIGLTDTFTFLQTLVCCTYLV